MFISFKAAKELTLTRMYETVYTSDDHEWLVVGDVRALCDDQFSNVFASKVLDSLVEDQTVERTFFEGDTENSFTITAKGIAAAERIVAKGASISPDLTAIPASDRIVTIDHNQPQVEEVLSSVEAASEAIRSSNTVSSEEKTWIRAQLDAGVALIRRSPQITLSAIKSLLLQPLASALKKVAEDNLSSVLGNAVSLIRIWLGY